MQYVYNISIIFCLFFLSSCDLDPLGLTKKHLYEDYYLHAFLRMNLFRVCLADMTCVDIVKKIFLKY